jgi:uncharacterized integral membrane protein
MAFGYLVVALLAAAVATFALQNPEPISVHFLFWSTQALPIAGVTLGALAAGLIVAGVPLAIARRRWRSRCRGLESRVATLESSLAERERALATPPAPPPRPPAPPSRSPEPPSRFPGPTP